MALPAAEPADAGLRRQVEALPEKQRQAVTLYYLDERAVDEVAEMMGLPVNTVKTHLHRARASLAAALGTRGGRVNDFDTRMRRLFAGVDTAPGFESRARGAHRVARDTPAAAALAGARAPARARAPATAARSSG